MKKRLVVIVLIFLLIIFTGVIYFQKINKVKYEYKEGVINKNYFLMYEDKYGVINKEGEIVINPQYDMIQIPNPEKPIFICMKNYNAETGEYETKVLNENEEEILTNFYRVEAIYISEPIEDIFYQTGVLKYKENGKYGLINLEGKKITKAIYEDIQSLEYKQGMLLVKENSKYGVINLKGQKIIDSKYDKIEADYFYEQTTKTNKARIYCIK